MKRKYLLYALLLGGCVNKSPKNCILTSSDLLSDNSNKVFVPVKQNGDILEINDKGIDSVKGGVYFFYRNGKLKAYDFFQNMQAYTYHEEYDKDGKLNKVVGKVLVDKKIKEVTVDSAFFKLYFFGLHKIYQPLRISINNTNQFNVELKDDTLYSNMKTVSFGLKTKALDTIRLIFYSEYRNECTDKVDTLRDTLSLIKNPHLNFEKTTEKR